VWRLESRSHLILGWVEAAQTEMIAGILNEVDPEIPVTILAFFPKFQLKDVPPPMVTQMLEAYERVRDVGLTNVGLGNVGVFVRTQEDLEALTRAIE
jgi:pyruvate formate lyase activating enzyme